ncbi:NUDIX domain-containing protein [Streptomyces sp. NBC_01443]|uniref:NUDIX hydrolase n=1 Tax=Streptomyces sp. NBC_01443 TaxID=2903868 RepID=UPI00224FFCC0|nr:NUDIX domain-containing protein [Streptomyces sp. NBC_01443]MCX4633111.1 NUDIX domain-containing protein [Streptomyces sp. NBC_01443]
MTPTPRSGYKTLNEGEKYAVPPSHTRIRKTVEAYLAHHPAERDALADLLTALDQPDDATSRSTLPGHVTNSAIVIDRDANVLHISHRVTGLLLAPGGHVEANDRSLLGAALRELEEEAGIPAGALTLTPQALGTPIDVDVHDIDENPEKGERAHRHYDIRYAFYLANEDRPEIVLQDQEVSGAQWVHITAITSPTLRAKLMEAGLDGQPEPVNASALIHDGAGSYLLHLRDERPEIWQPWTMALVGGGRRRGDRSLEDTLLRELSEEVPGLHLEGLEPYAVEEAVSVDGLRVPIHVFSGRWNGNPDQLQLREGVLLHWFAPDELDRLRLSPGLADLIRRHAAEHPATALPDEAAPAWDGGSRPVLNGIGVHLHLEDPDGRVLLGLRHPDVIYAGNTWHFLAGKCEQESAVTCLVREAREEAGLVIDPADVKLVHVVHVVDTPGGQPLMHMVFQADRWEGIPELREPHKCLAWQWWEPANLPERLVPYTRAAIEGITAGRHYTELGWDR